MVNLACGNKGAGSKQFGESNGPKSGPPDRKIVHYDPASNIEPRISLLMGEMPDFKLTHR